MIKGFFGFISALGLFFAVFGIYFIIAGYGARSWPAAEGMIEATNVRVNILLAGRGSVTDSSREARRTYYPEITYRWMVDGQTYTGTRFALGEAHPDFPDRQDAQEAARRFPSGQAIDVYFDPEDPGSAVIDRSLKLGAFVPLPLGLFFAAFGVFGLRMVPAMEAAMARGAEITERLPGAGQ